MRTDMIMLPGQLITYMEGNLPFKPRRIKISTILIGSRFDSPEQRYWETMIFNEKDGNIAKSLFDYTYQGGNNIERRTRQHYSVSFVLEKAGYKVVSHQDDLKERYERETWGALTYDLKRINQALDEQRKQRVWDNILQGIQSLDLFDLPTGEWNRLNFLKYLRTQGEI